MTNKVLEGRLSDGMKAGSASGANAAVSPESFPPCRAVWSALIKYLRMCTVRLRMYTVGWGLRMYTVGYAVGWGPVSIHRAVCSSITIQSPSAVTCPYKEGHFIGSV